MKDEELKEIETKKLDFLENIKKLLEKIVELSETEKHEGIVETFEVTATTQFITLWPPMSKKGERPKWLWVQFVNDSATIDAYCGVNEGSANALKVAAGETQKIQFGDKKVIEYVNYKTLTGTADMRIIFAR